MKILFVNEALHGDQILGPEAFGDAVRTGLDGRDDVDARFLRIGPAGPAGRALTYPLPVLDRADLDFHELRWFAVHGLRARSLVRRELERFPASVVHLNTHALALGRRIVDGNVPLVLSADAPVWEWRVLRSAGVRPHSWAFSRPCRALERRALERASTVLAYTGWARDRLAAAAPGARIVVRNPGVDVQRFRPAGRQPRRLPRLVFVGGRFAEKGGGDLLAALDGLLGRTVELDVVTREPPPARPGLRVHRLSRSDPAFVELLQQADLFCLPTHADTMSFAAMEALACGTPAVVSSVAGVPEVVGEAGVVVPPGDVRVLREAIESLVADETRRLALGRAGRERAEGHFDARVQTGLLVDHAREAAARVRGAVEQPLRRSPA